MSEVNAMSLRYPGMLPPGLRENNTFKFLTSISGKPIPTKKLAIQFTRTAILTAAGRESWLNNSAVMNHGMDPKRKHIVKSGE